MYIHLTSKKYSIVIWNIVNKKLFSMDTNEDLVEEQDPDYATSGPSNSIQQQKLYEKTARANTSRKINAIIEKEFTREIDNKENEILVIQNRLSQALKTLHLLRYVIITDFYNRKQCNVEPQTKPNESKQTRIHPAIKQVINQPPTKSLLTSSYITPTISNNKSNISKSQRADTESMELSHSITISNNEDEFQMNSHSENDNEGRHSRINKKKLSDSHESDSNGPLKKIPRHIPPKYDGPQRLPSRGDRHKIIKRIVVGNISKWIPPDWRDDEASHKWTMYVRGSKEDAKIDDFIAKIRFFLHPSYRPNDVVEVTSPPFHLSRRGWGEFPLRVQLHFKNSTNKPMDIIHNLKLDRTYTGLQTLGSETIVDVWINAQDYVQQSQQQLSIDSIKKERIDVEQHLTEQENNVTIVEHSSHNETNEIVPHYYALMDHDYVNRYPLTTNNSKSNDNHSDDNNINVENGIENDDDKMNNENARCNESKTIDSCIELKPLEIIIPSRFSCLAAQKPHLKTSSHMNVKQVLILNENQSIPVNFVKKNSSSSSGASRNSGVSLLKFKLNPAKSLLLESNSNIPALQIAHVSTKSNEKNSSKPKVTVGKDKVKITTKRDYYESILKLINNVKITDIESLLRFIIKRVPIIHENASDPEYRKIHPYVCSSEREFNDFNIGKQRALEWYRAKALRTYLKDKSLPDDQLWTVKEIMIWCRIHGYTPAIGSPIFMPTTSNTSATAVQSTKESLRKKPGDKCEKILFNTNTAPTALVTWQKNAALSSNILHQAEELIDVVNFNEGALTGIDGANQFCGIDQNNSDRMIMDIPKNILPLYSFVCETARVIGIQMAPEELEPGISHCVATRLIVKSLQCLLEDLLRSSLAKAWERNSKNGSCPNAITLEDVHSALINRDEFDVFTNSGLMYVPPQHQPTSDHN